MGMNIKNPEAHALAREIAARTGLSLTDAVLAALREKRAALADAAEERAQADSLLAYGRRLTEARAAARQADTASDLRHRRSLRRDARPAGMIVDSSAVLAIFFEEPEAPDLVARLGAAGAKRISAVN